MDRLLLSRSSGELTVENCLAKVQFFCLYDAFPAYDVIGQRNEHDTDTFQRELLHVMNRAMRARSSCKAWEPFLDKVLPVLSAIPTDIDLVESSDTEYTNVREALRSYYLFITNSTWITDMAASKMLFLKRPRLTAISDSYVRAAFCIPDPKTQEYPWKAQYCAERALRVSDMARSIGLANIKLLECLQREMVPTIISKVRLIDILIWVDEAIRAKHPMWSSAAKAKGWGNESDD